MFEIRIPKERIGVLVGPGGQVKRDIEATTETVVKVGSDGLIVVRRRGEDSDPVGELKARDVVRAIGRGFSALNALRICEEECVLEVVELRDYVKRSGFDRIRARIIGSEGKARRQIEQKTCTNISIYGKTVGIIGKMEDVSAAKEAVVRLAKGQEHSTVFKFLDRRMMQHGK